MSFKKVISKIPLAGSLARELNYQFQGAEGLELSFWLGRILKQESGYAVQIGSNDAGYGDPLYKFLVEREKWKGLFVEPVPFLFERLKNAYVGHQRFRFENSVINDGSEKKFYWVAENAKESLPDLPVWHDQLGGFNRDHITRHIPELEPFINEKVLNGISIETLLKKHDIKAFDLLHIDTEGADFKILSQLQLATYLPTVIIYEQSHLSNEEKQGSYKFLKEQYVLFDFGVDILAIEREVAKRFWLTLNPLRSIKLTID